MNHMRDISISADGVGTSGEQIGGELLYLQVDSWVGLDLVFIFLFILKYMRHFFLHCAGLGWAGLDSFSSFY